MSSNDTHLPNRLEASTFPPACHRRNAETAPLSTGATLGDEIEIFDFRNARGMPVRNPTISTKDASSRFIAAPIEFKFASDQITAGTISGYGSVSGVRDMHGDIVEKSAFAATIRQHKADKTAPVMLWGHDPDRVIGVWDAFEEDGHGLKVTGRLNLDTQDGREAHALLKQGALSGLSIGYRVMPGGAKIDRDGVRRLSALDLWEVSLVAFPSNRQSRVHGVKAIESRTDFERFLREADFSKSAARKLAAGGWPALQPDEPGVGDLLVDIRKATSELKGISR